MSPSARCVYGCEKLREWGEGGVLRFLGVVDKNVTALFGVGFPTEVSFSFIKYSNWCYTYLERKLNHRTFKTRKFSQMADSARISDEMLCRVIQSLNVGLAVDLGGGVYKKRLNNNQHRAIVLAKVGAPKIYQYLYAKNALSNIAADDLKALKELAKFYQSLTKPQIDQLVVENHFFEICHDQ